MYENIDLILKIKLYRLEFKLFKIINKRSPNLFKNYKKKLKDKILNLDSKIDERFK